MSDFSSGKESETTNVMHCRCRLTPSGRKISRLNTESFCYRLLAFELLMDTILYIIAGPLFLISLAAHLFVKLRLRPKDNSDLDEYYHEFEDSHPELARYNKLSRLTFTAAVIAALLLFLAVAL